MSVTYHPVLTISGLVVFQHVMMHIGNEDVSIHSQLGLRREQLAMTAQEGVEHTLKT